jgi:aminotransferase
MKHTKETYVVEHVSGIPRENREMIHDYAKQFTGIINLAIGNPDLPTPEYIINKTKEALEEGFTKYTDYYGMLDLRESVSESIYLKTGVSYDPVSEIIITHGGQEAIFISVQALLGVDDEIVIPTPHFAPFERAAYFARAKTTMLELNESEQYRPNRKQLSEAIGLRTKALIMSNPVNPLGVVWNGDDLAVIAEAAINADLIVIADEIYDQIIDLPYPGSLAALPDMRERVLMINSFSKAYSMTGLRVGYLAGPAKLIKEIKKLHYNITLCPCSLSQKAALAALSCPEEELAPIANTLNHRRKILYEALFDIPRVKCVEPHGGLFAYPNFSYYANDSIDFSKELIKNTSVITLPGESSSVHLRFSVCTTEENIVEGVSRIKKYLQNR